MFGGGVEMMLKSFGIDPNQIAQTAQETAERILKIEQGLARIEGKLDTLISALNSSASSEEPANTETIK